MKHIKPKIEVSIPLESVNYDYILNKFEENTGVCVVADGNKNKGILSNEWAKYLCEKTPFAPIISLSGLEVFIETIWEEFYETAKDTINDNFQLSAFEKQGSLSTYTACWFRQDEDKTFYNWISYGNSTVLVYDKENDELFVPNFGNSILDFIKNTGLINWKEESLIKDCFYRNNEMQLKNNSNIIIASDVVAEFLVLSYLIIKSKNDDYWEQLLSIMKSNDKLCDYVFNNRNAYAYSDFRELLAIFENEINNDTISDFIGTLQSKNQIAKDDISLHIIEYNQNYPDYLTKHQAVVNKTYTAPTVKYKPVVKKHTFTDKEEYKNNKEAIIDCLLDNKVFKLYHFTDYKNIESIKKLGGLYSWDYMLENNIYIPMSGGGQLSRMLDCRYGLENYVRTSICKNHPMMYVALNEGRISNPVILEIDPQIASLKDTLYSNMNATKTGHHSGGSISDLKKIRFNICLNSSYRSLSDSEKSYYQAEIMVKQFIPEKYILNLHQL